MDTASSSRPRRSTGPDSNRLSSRRLLHRTRATTPSPLPKLALSLHAIVFQQLLPRADGAGRIPTLELLLGTYPVRHHIRSQNLQKLYNEITLGKAQGMFSFEDSLATLVKEGKIDPEEARMRSARPDELESLMRK
jgi:Tfp pilus assembly pilus retraction ATPase PilT